MTVLLLHDTMQVVFTRPIIREGAHSRLRLPAASFEGSVTHGIPCGLVGSHARAVPRGGET
jgi:hypothetical protein